MATTSKVTPVGCKVTRGLLGDCRVVLHLNPVPASRPRVTRWGTYYTKTYREWMQIAEASIPQAAGPFPGIVRAECEFYVERPRTSKLERPIGDIDNYLKSIFDAITKKGYWLDDVEIVSVKARKEFVPIGEGRVEILIEDKT